MRLIRKKTTKTNSNKNKFKLNRNLYFKKQQ